jgi:glycosyltransferase involved in cell wall biosynthesis
VVFSEAHRDPRILRQVAALNDDHKISVAAYTDPRVDGVDFIKIPNRRNSSLPQKALKACLLLLRLYDTYYWMQSDVIHLKSLVKETEFDLIIANEVNTLPVCLDLANEKPIISDLHEYYPAQFEDQLKVRIFFKGYKAYLCRKFIKEATIGVSVCESISMRYENETGLEFNVITNAPEYVNLHPKKTAIKIKRLIHHGGANPSRKLEQMIEMMNYLPDEYELHLMLFGSDDYIKKLKALAKGKPILFHEPVEFNKIIHEISKFDIGICCLYPSNYNLLHALPNKLFEFVQARLPIVVSPSPEMKKIVETYKLGTVANGFSAKDYAHAVQSITMNNINQIKASVDLAALQLCAASNEGKYRKLVDRLL